MSTKHLKVFCIIIYVAIGILSIILFKKINLLETTQEQLNVKFDKTIEKLEIITKTNPLMDISVSLCKNEYAKDIANAVYKVHENTGYPLYVIYALIATESDSTNINNILTESGNFNPYAKSKGYGCIGLTQISPKYALKEYNKYNKTNLITKDLYDIETNIKIGLWYFNQFRSVSSDYIEQYMIYNVGYSEYNKINKNYFYDMNDKWLTGYKNSYFYKMDMFPPTKSYKQGLYGNKNKLPKYNARKRFETYLNYYKKLFGGN